MEFEQTSEYQEWSLRNWTWDLDTCQDSERPIEFHTECGVPCQANGWNIEMKRDLPPAIGKAAAAYIAVILRSTPHQLRQAMAEPMWHRFLFIWSETGSQRKAMRVI